MLRWIRERYLRSREENDLAEELRAHLAIEVRQRVEAGHDPAEAERAARRVFGNIANVHEETREAWGWGGVRRFFDDIRVGFRMLRRSAAWTAVICSMLALGIGLTTAIFSVFYSVLLQPLPYPDSGRLMALWPSAPKYGYPRFSVSAALWVHWRERAKSFSDIAVTRALANFNITGDGPPERLEGARNSANLPQVLGVAPLIGRVFSEEEEHSNANVAVLSHGLWQRRFGSDPEILGRKIPLNGEPFEVIGVMPPNYGYPSSEFELWAPLYIPPAEILDGQNYQYISVGRLRKGVSLKQARAEMVDIMRRLAEEYPAAYRIDDENLQVLVEPLAESDAVQVRDTLYALLSAAGCLLLIGSMNLAVLLTARGSARAREMAIRAALGASSARLRRQMLVEVLPLSVAGAAGGTLLAWWMLKVLVTLLPANTPRLDTIGLHAPMLGFAVVASVMVVLLAGLLPAHVASRRRLAGTLQQNSRSVAGGGRARSVLVIAQTAVTLVLLLTGTLFARSLQALLQVNPGFSTRGVLTMHLTATRAQYPTDRQVSDYYERLIERVRSVPGVTSAGVVNRLPLSGIAQTGPIEFEGTAGRFDVDWRSATPGYFEAIGIPLERGRLFANSDRNDSPAVGLIDGQIARKVFDTEDPIGRRFRISLGATHGPWTEIVGVVGHILNDTPEQDYRSQVYWPQTQRTQDRGALVVSTTGDPESLTTPIVEQIHKEDPEQPVYDVRSMEQWFVRTLQSRNLLTGLVGLFGGASLLLACLGLYGVVSYTVSLRLREFGIRMALGANAAHVRSLVLRHSGRLTLLGSAAGLALAWPVVRAIQSLLFGVTPVDAVSWVLAPALMIVVGLLAGFGPARRAARIDAAVTLRAE